MSIDTHILLETPLSAEGVRAALLHAPELADLGLVDLGTGSVGGKPVTALVGPWTEDDRDLIENGFETATVRIKLFPRGGSPGWDAFYRVLAAILRQVPGDVCLANQDAAGPDLLRLGEVLYVDPDGFRPENLTDFGYHPERIVAGIPTVNVQTAR